jgi:hypothetical protein
MNMHVELTPTQRQAFERRRNFRATIAARAAELEQRKIRQQLAAIPVAAIEAPLIHVPEVVVVEPSEPTPAENWFVILGDDGRQRHLIRQIQSVVCQHFNKKLSDMYTRRRTADIVLPRQIAMFLCKDMTPHSLPEIGRRFGGRDHTTVLHAVRKLTYMIERSPKFAEEIQIIRAKIQ